MQIALNAQLLNTGDTYRSAGVSNYCRSLLGHLGELLTTGGTAHQFLAFTNTRDFHAQGITISPTSWPLHNPIARIIWEQTQLPLALPPRQVELLHGLVNVLPLATRIPGVVTVHDLSFVRLPENFPVARRRYLAYACRASVERARRVIAVSQQTATDIMHFFRIPASKISVVYNGVDADFQPLPTALNQAFRQRNNLPERFWLYVGTLEPRKNLERLITSFARWRTQANDADQRIKLVLAGGKGWFYEQIFARVTELGIDGHVLFPGYIADDDLPNWYCAAEAFLYPSLFEGFGLPVLEAMACGTPVLCSQASSLLEIVADCALTFPAESESALIDGLSALATQPALRTELRRKGLARATEFSWHRSAVETVAVYDSI